MKALDPIAILAIRHDRRVKDNFIDDRGVDLPQYSLHSLQHRCICETERRWRFAAWATAESRTRERDYPDRSSVSSHAYKFGRKTKLRPCRRLRCWYHKFTFRFGNGRVGASLAKRSLSRFPG